MAQRRMFSKTITNSSQFLMMPSSTQSLYFHLGMNADDDGFCEHFTVMRMTDSKPDDLKLLQAKGFVHVFDDRVLVILDWKENNYLRADRYTKSKYMEIYKKEMQMLSETQCLPVGIPCVNQEVDERYTQDRIGKDRKGKDSNICKENIPFSDIIAYLNEVCKTRYKVTENHRSHIHARWNEGMRLEDFKTVIDKKYTQWGSDEQMSKYLRPQTLFGTKMDGYVNEIVAGKKEPEGLRRWKKKHGIVDKEPEV